MTNITQTIAEISQLIQTIPKESLLFIGTLLGALLGLVGSVFAVIVSLISLWLQLRHNRKESKRDRDFDLKREILLNITEAVTKANELLSTMPTKPVNEINSQFSTIELGSHINKLHLVGTLDTIKSLGQYMKSYFKSYFVLLIARGKIDRIEFDIRLATQEIDELSKHREGINAQLNALPPHTDPNIFMQLREFQADISERIAHIYEVNSKRHDIILKMQAKYSEISIGAMLEAGPYGQEALISARKELDLDLNEKEYRRVNEDTSNYIRKLLQKFMEDVKMTWNQAYDDFGVPELLPESSQKIVKENEKK